LISEVDMSGKESSIQDLLNEVKRMEVHIRELEKKESILRSREEMYREMVHSANSIIICWNAKGEITFFNKFAQNFFGYREKEILGKSVVDTIVPREDAKGINLVALMKDICTHPEKYVNNENENIKKNGERVWISWTNKPVYTKQGKFLEILSVGNDITRRKKAEDELERFATTDMMTGVLNRRAGLAFLEKSLHLAKRHGYKLTICYVDVNNLKIVNDTIGHNEGDELIKTVSEVLKKSLRISDTVCRLGGDEFLMILPKCSLRTAKKLWKRVSEKLEALNSRKNKKYPVSVSRGFLEFDPKQKVPPINEFISAADAEMYKEKRKFKEKTLSSPLQH